MHFMNNFSTRKQIDPYCRTLAGNYSINGGNLKKIMIKFPQELGDQKNIIKNEILNQKNIIKISQIIDESNRLRNNVLSNLKKLYQ